ncbi:MAG TPA: hypothetical protein VGZ47_06955 [Gemmataceae bacterium]|nr:hypothetical protein [Gemmataceae bacterium]
MKGMKDNQQARTTSFGSEVQSDHGFIQFILGKVLPGRAGRMLNRLKKYLKRYDRAAFSELGTLNNQRERERIVKNLLRDFQPAAIVETGTYLGAGTKFFLGATQSCPILSCEIDPDYFAFCRRRFRNEPRISLFKCDSATFLRQLSFERNANLAFYLDAHWYDHLPLRDEVSFIVSRYPNALILVDDFAVPHDPGYGFDDYGIGRRLDAEYLAPLSDRILIFYPTVLSEEETGARRGYCFVCLPASRAHEVLSAHRELAAARSVAGTHAH